MTAVEWLIDELKDNGIRYLDLADEIIQQALEMEKQQSQDYANFAIYCDRKELPILNFEDYIKLQ